MLKIYNAFANHGKIKLNDYITFDNGIFDTGVDGFGYIRSGDTNCRRANYERQRLKQFRENLKNVKTSDGYVTNFVLWNPIDYATLADVCQVEPKTAEIYERYDLNEEGILLFTNYVWLEPNDDKTQRLFGRDFHTGLYLLLPEASINMAIPSRSIPKEETYEVLQSKRLCKQLVLTKLNRKI